MATTAQIMRLLAVKRGLDPDICALAGVMHDVATMESGKAENHAAHALHYIALLINEYNESKYANRDELKITLEEITWLEEIIPHHSDKEVVSNHVYIETLKDADALDRYLQGVETKEHEIPRLVTLFKELGSTITFT